MSRPVLARGLVKLHADLPRKSMRLLTTRFTSWANAAAASIERSITRIGAGRNFVLMSAPSARSSE